MSQMPVIVAFGVNFGIVPLLFLQVAYNKAFYPATILMAWFWMGVIALLIPAYYGVYVYAFGLRGGRAALALAAGRGVALGDPLSRHRLPFRQRFEPDDACGGWPQLLENHGSAGAALGTALNTADPTLWPRWLLMFGLAWAPPRCGCSLDAAWFAAKESHDYARWVKQFATRLYVVSFAWTAAVGSWYVLGTWTERFVRACSAGRSCP